MFRNHIIGMPIIGKNRELKFAIENYIRNRNTTSLSSLRNISKGIIRCNIESQLLNRLDFITIGTFCYPDPVTYSTILLGFISREYISKCSMFDTILNITRGNGFLPALNMTKWFGMNYHYFKPLKCCNYNNVPFLNFVKYEISLLGSLGFSNVKFSIIGPFTMCLLIGFSSRHNISFLILRYNLFFSKLLDLGLKYIQIEEPFFSDYISNHKIQLYSYIYSKLQHKLRLIFTSYFNILNSNLRYINTYGLHIDLISNTSVIKNNYIYSFKFLSFGVVVGNNVWITSFKKITNFFKASNPCRDIYISPNCSFRHIPYDLTSEPNNLLLPNIYLSFLVQKLSELVSITCILNKDASYKKLYIRNILLNKGFVKFSNVFNIKPNFSLLVKKKRTYLSNLGIGILPLTTIGSFPQTSKLRSLRSRFVNGQLSRHYYRSYILSKILYCYKLQSNYGVNLFTNGELERSDMVQYFCGFIEGCLITKNGWVQSYCTRCVKPPILWGNMSFKGFNSEYDYISILSNISNLKYILTGPITLLKWSYINTNLDLKSVIFSLSNSISSIISKVCDIGIKFIQIDEPAIVEFINYYSLYYNYSYISALIVDSFRICYSSILGKNIQIHTHICYSDFNSNIANILKSLGVDKVSFESSRNLSSVLKFITSNKLLNYFEVGLGLYDVHSDTVPSTLSLINSLSLIIKEVGYLNIWINPDCGLKTRSYTEVCLFLKRISYVLGLFRSKIRSS
ncbi:hypothetical protein [Candidatus Vidania fulgoroideorum]